MASNLIRRFLNPTTTSRLFRATTFSATRTFTTTSRLLSSRITEIQDEDDFNEKVLKSKTPVVLDFHANWCGPCKVLGPRLEKVVSGWKDEVTMAKLDVDNSELEDITAKYRISAVPTVILVEDGKKIGEFTGVKEEEKLKEFLDTVLNGKR